ncbi:MAG TPA: carbamoyltransferase HypF [Methanococcaceae archaeon]|uniref:Carbamoyltransferase n=1 Tax=Methanothermococcus okinawensis TaxID=155863 RepID=A0A832ZKB5_9EURY|nr:carbamoyltransferase HypF [Methanococcaceae archaeon]HIP91769.1 carbamoyltransferase HypF [Methanothermococcus okinawensis]
MMKKRIVVKGIVQGVGFRPFIYRIARENNLKGYVKNMGNYVEIVVDGNEKDIENFLRDIRDKKPPLASIEEIEIGDYNLPLHYRGFTIEGSGGGGEGVGTVPPDVSICEECLREMWDRGNRRYRYPFIACTNCGPRFTIVKRLPYDRDNTSMAQFPLCEECLREYTNPLDRRFHAQATCCPRCGPKVYLLDSDGNILYQGDDAIVEGVKLLNEGNILAVKGIGGTHLACRCDRDDVVLKLRRNLNRPTQPFAVMAKEEDVELFAEIEEEWALLKSPRRPIVVVKKGKDYSSYFSRYVSNLDTVGVMLPYSGLHYLLLESSEALAYVMTSANFPGHPMVKDNREIVQKLKGVSDYFLIHDREIVNRCDDSVVKKVNSRKVFLRRSRGYVPEPVVVLNHRDIRENRENIIAVGPEMNSTACLVKGNRFYLSQHIGNTSKYETFKFLREGIENLLRITDTRDIHGVVCDLHPGYNSTRLAKELAERFDAELYSIQHHKAHTYSLLGDEDNFQESIVIAVDGIGYGEDNKIWGGEVFIYRDNTIERLGHLEEQYMPGGDLCTEYPLRMLMAILYKRLNREELLEFIGSYNILDYRTLELILFQLDRGINVIETTSCGRVLDAISAMLSICHRKTYDGEPAIRLESFVRSRGYRDREYRRCLEIVREDIKIKNSRLITSDLVYRAYNMLLEGYEREFIGLYIHLAIGEGLSSMAVEFGEREGVEYIGLTGGVSYNSIISQVVKRRVEEEGFKFLYHSRVPNGDGGISFGQAIGYILK